MAGDARLTSDDDSDATSCGNCVRVGRLRAAAAGRRPGIIIIIISEQAAADTGGRLAMGLLRQVVQ